MDTILDIDPSTWFITGGTPGGFGLAYAEAALALGANVALTVRRPEALQDWGERHGDRVLILQVDITDPGQIRAAVASAENRFGGIDVLVNNAGRGWYGSVEGMTAAAARASMDLNFFAPVDVLRAVLPGMRARGTGWILNMSSVAGLRGEPGFGYYSAAKFALEGLTETLRLEVQPFGIKVMLVEPGAFRTRAYDAFANEPVTETVDAYVPMVEAVRTRVVAHSGRQPGDPARGVQAVINAMRRDEPPMRLVLGGDAHTRVVSHLRDKAAEIAEDRAAAFGADYPTPA